MPPPTSDQDAEFGRLRGLYLQWYNGPGHTKQNYYDSLATDDVYNKALNKYNGNMVGVETGNGDPNGGIADLAALLMSLGAYTNPPASGQYTTASGNVVTLKSKSAPVMKPPTSAGAIIPIVALVLAIGALVTLAVMRR